MSPKQSDEWVESPSLVRVKRHENISVQNTWQNKKTGEVVVQYMTMTTVERNHYVESHSSPETANSKIRQVKNMLSSDDIETEVSKVSVTGGNGIAKCRSRSTAQSKAHAYMNGDQSDFYYER